MGGHSEACGGVFALGAQVVNQGRTRRQQRPRPRPSFDQTLPETHAMSPFRYALQEGQSAPATMEMDSLKLQLEQGNVEAQKRAIDRIFECALGLAFDRQGCRLVQSAIENKNANDFHKVVAGLQGHVWRAMQCRHANHVLQKIIVVLPPTRTNFIAKELLNAPGEAARHEFGCRIICRLMEHADSQTNTRVLIDEILKDALELSEHPFGHLVLRSILEHGMLEQRALIACALQGRVTELAMHQHGSFIVQQLLEVCDEKTRTGLANELLQNPETVTILAHHRFGKHVAKQLRHVPGASEIAIKLPQKQTNKQGRRFLKKAGFRVA